MRTNQELVEFIDHLIKTKHGTATDLASEIGMSLSAFSRAVREEGTLSDGNCIKLASLCGERLSRVLQLARRAADVIEAAESLYDEDGELTRRERRLVRLWRNAPPTAQDAHMALLQICVESAQHAVTTKTAKTGKTKRTEGKRALASLRMAKRFPVEKAAATR